MPADAVVTTRRGGGTRPRPLRADAQQNRDRAVEAARVVFCELGAEASMAEIARRAGVGLATLFRRFPTKEELLLEVFADHVTDCVAAMDQALGSSDPWQAIRVLVRDVCAKQASDKALASVLIWVLTGDMSLEVRSHVESGFAELLARAKAAGAIRQDIEYSDVILIMMANVGVVTMSTDSVAEDSRRMVDLMLTSLETSVSH
ncbi:TetR/AcrR family transcriptional regulator [Rhodococcus baikonurensis]|uniref:TetR/AcrR family transcriptional regulator n=1 Tax=Rhodococcus erythropolis group TaxID=2840174 RepID=UPI000BB35FF7|nr:TetR/AcrR family transcriptional regulator [Rhodococcus erythropolis]